MNRQRLTIRRWRLKPRQGVMLILGAFMMSMLMMFAAFAIDIGFIVLTQAQLQNAADAAALGATLELKTSDAALSRADIRRNALDQAKAVALLNYAAGRPVVLYDEDITLGNRSFDNDQNKWVTIPEDDPNFGTRKYNTVAVSVTFDQETGPRRRLDLFFARVLGHNTAAVDGDSRSHLTPRDLVFCIDISGSMFGDSGGNTPGRDSGSARNWCKLIFEDIYGSSRPYKRCRLDDYQGKYKKIWIDSFSDGAWGDNSDALAFIKQEFPGYDEWWNWDDTKPWSHWKWRAYCDFAFCTQGGGSWNDQKTENIYKGINGQVKNLNVTLCTTMAYWKDGHHVADVGPVSYTSFIVWNGYVPCIRGQKHYPRDANQDGYLDNPVSLGYPDENVDAPYPDFIGFYPQVRDFEGYNYLNLFSGGKFTGVYPGDIDGKPMSIVRQSTLLGIHAMIESEDQFNQEIVFNQVGLVPFATMGYACLDLGNDLQTALQVASSRLTTYPGNSYISPHGSGATNIGMGIKRSLQLLIDPDGRGRSFANKTIALLTDGEPTYSIDGHFEDLDYDPATQIEYLQKNGSHGKSYARHYASKCGELGVVLHTIGLGNAGTGSSVSFLEDLADRANGTFKAVPSVKTEAQKEELRQLFIAIGKDKLGKLYLE